MSVNAAIGSITTNLLNILTNNQKVSDLLIKFPVSYYRDNGEIKKTDIPPLTEEQHQNLVTDIFKLKYGEIKAKDIYEATILGNKEQDFAIQIPNSPYRARVNVSKSNGGLFAVLRKIPIEIPLIDDLGFKQLHKDTILNMVGKREGLILVTGQTGTGKSTTLASIIENINKKQNKHIVTIEEPIEFRYEEKMCAMSQREVGPEADTKSFASGVIASLRQTPDIILIGEIRDTETAMEALKASQTGHLVFATLHTNSAPETIIRIVDMFPADLQSQVKVSLANSLLMIISQKLTKNKLNNRSLVYEILVKTDQIANSVRSDKDPINRIKDMMIQGQRDGMILMDYCIAELVKDGLLDKDNALNIASDRGLLEKKLGVVATSDTNKIF